MATQRKIYHPGNYRVFNICLWILGLTIMFSLANDWGNWSDIWFLPALVLVFVIISYLYVYKIWRIEITPEGTLLSKAGFTIDFNIDIASIRTLEKGTYVFPIPQPVLVITFTLDGKQRYRQLHTPAWGDHVLGQIIRDVITINPSIQLDEYAKEFLAAASS
jgi:hypothetical protein